MGSMLHALKELASFINTLFILGMLLVLFGYMGYSLFYITPYITNPNFLIPIYIVIPYPQLLFYLQGITSYVWYIFLASAISVSGVLLVIYGIIPYYKKFSKHPFSYKKNVFQELSELYTVNIFFSMLIVYILLLARYIPQTPGIGKLPMWAQMLELLHASVYEELIVRTVYLGIPVFIVYLLRGKKISPLRILGGYGRITSVEVVFIVISASIFAIAHIPAWNVWKVMPTFVGGLILGYLYIKYGIYASILMHFMTDFITIPMDMNPEYRYMFGFFMIIFAIVGAIFFVSYLIKITKYFTRKSPKPSSSPKQPPQQPQWINLVCPNCGGRVFQYVDKNTVRCVNCNTLIHINEQEDDSEDYFI